MKGTTNKAILVLFERELGGGLEQGTVWSEH
jgi:hypothetical protein